PAALDEEHMAGPVPAIDMVVARIPAQVAGGNDMVGNPLRHAAVEYEILAQEFVFQSLRLRLAEVFYDAPFQLENLSEPLMPEIRAGLFAAYAARAVQDEVLVFLAVAKSGF